MEQNRRTSFKSVTDLALVRNVHGPSKSVFITYENETFIQSAVLYKELVVKIGSNGRLIVSINFQPEVCQES